MDTSKLKLRFKLRPNEEVVTFMSIPPRRYLLVKSSNTSFLQAVRKATHEMNMPVQHVYSSNGTFEGFRAPHYVIEDVRWKMEMAEKGMSIEASPKQKREADDVDDEIEKLIKEMEAREKMKKKVERKNVKKLSSEESSWLEDDSEEMDSEDEDEDYVPSSDGESSTISGGHATLRSGRTVSLRLKE